MYLDDVACKPSDLTWDLLVCTGGLKHNTVMIQWPFCKTDRGVNPNNLNGFLNNLRDIQHLHHALLVTKGDLSIRSMRVVNGEVFCDVLVAIA